jgi:glycosyltransferase involved in cell wall biosynthesis
MRDSDERLSKLVFVVFSDDWARHPSSCQHLFLRILPRADVLWVNTVGLRSPRLSVYDIRRACQVIFSWLKFPSGKAREAGKEAAVAGPRVIRPLMWPSFGRAWSAALNQRLLSRAVRRALAREFPGKESILVSTLPIVPGLFREDRFRRKIYYCVDDFTQWHGIDGKAMQRLERKTLEACHLLIATSRPILEARAPLARASALLTHGVDVAHFRDCAPDPRSPLAGARRPVVGMFGVFDRRVDAEILRAAARSMPEATFAVIGPVVDRAHGEFQDLPNLNFLGPLPYAELPGHVAHFDLCILPYVLDETTRGINPLKLKEYLATGKPVVSTRLPEAVRLGEFLILAEPGRFTEAIAGALAPGWRETAGLKTFLLGESWDAKADQFLAEVMQGL